MASKCIYLSLILEWLIQSAAWCSKNYLKKTHILGLENNRCMRILLYLFLLFLSIFLKSFITKSHSYVLFGKFYMWFINALQKFFGIFLVFLLINILPSLAIFWKRQSFLCLFLFRLILVGFWWLDWFEFPLSWLDDINDFSSLF